MIPVRNPYFADDAVTLYQGDALDVLRELPSGSADCVVTSPPYYGLRDYGEPGQYGLEETPAAYVETMRQVFAEARRALADDGTLWLNLGDSYAGVAETGRKDAQEIGRDGLPQYGSMVQPERAARRLRITYDVPRKSLLGIPWRVAFALQDDGWILRNQIVWAKTNAMPESVADRLSGRHETVFLFAKSQRYWFDLDSIREPHADSTVAAAARARKPYVAPGQKPNGKTRGMAEGGANPGDVWLIPTQPFTSAHFAVMPPALAERCILAGCRPGGVVLDPFTGSGTTGMVAGQLGRRFTGIDLSSAYLDLALRTRLAQGVLLDASVTRPYPANATLEVTQ